MKMIPPLHPMLSLAFVPILFRCVLGFKRSHISKRPNPANTMQRMFMSNQLTSTRYTSHTPNSHTFPTPSPNYSKPQIPPTVHPNPNPNPHKALLPSLAPPFHPFTRTNPLSITSSQPPSAPPPTPSRPHIFKVPPGSAPMKC